MSKFQIRNMTQEEVRNYAVEWAKQEGWNPGLYDSECFYKADPNGFFAGVLDGEIIGTISVVRYDSTYGFGGFYIVKNEHRGKGYGMQLFEHALEYLGDRNFGGDGVVENLEMYKTVGLELDHMNARYKGFGTGKPNISENVIPLSQISLDDLSEYDAAVFGFTRESFLKCWIDQPDSFSYGYLENGKLMGYGVLRKCFNGYKIGPLFADTDKIASELYSSLVNQVGSNDEIFFDIPEVSAGSLAIVEKHNMEKIFATGRIYTKGRPKEIDLSRWYGVTSFELG